MSSSSVDTFLFDLDGTLIDSIELIRRSFRQAMLVHRGWDPPHDEWLGGLGLPLERQFEEYADDASEVAAMIATYRKYNAEHHDAMVRAYPGTRELVRELRQRGARLGIVTSKLHERAVHGLAHSGFEPADFAIVIGKDDVAQHKPNPDPVLAALAGLDSTAERAVFIGDSPHDLAAGRAARVATGAVTWGPFPRAWLEPAAPDHWFDRPSEIAALWPRS